MLKTKQAKKGMALNPLPILDAKRSRQMTLNHQGISARSKTLDAAKDTFSAANRDVLERRDGDQRQRHTRMKKYGRWLFYAGVEHLTKDQKKVYAFEKQREEERKRAKASVTQWESPGISARLDSAGQKGRQSQV